MLLCVLASLALHCAVLFLFPGLRAVAQPDSKPRFLTAMLTPRVALPERARVEPQVTARHKELEQSHSPPRPEPVMPLPVPENFSATPQAALVAEASPAAASANLQPSLQTARSEASATQSSVPSRRTPEAPAASAANTQSSARAGDAADLGTLDQYRLALIGSARKYKLYPAQAMEKGWAGKVEVRLVIGANGFIQNVLVKTSSGYELLDNTALDMVTKAKPITPIPAALRGHEFKIDIPVIFELQTG
jgi:protein TonB